MSDVRTPELVINKLSKQQYESIQNPSDTELYLVPDDEEHKPICYPTTATNVGTTSMLVKSSVSDNGKILTENGFVYNTSGNPTVSDTKVICDLCVGFMEKKLENLTMNTEYHIKSYGQNASGLVYGSELVQRTLLNPIPIEYQLVEYLENSGTQYLTLNYMPLYTDDLYCKFVLTSLDNYGILWGAGLDFQFFTKAGINNGFISWGTTTNVNNKNIILSTDTEYEQYLSQINMISRINSTNVINNTQFGTQNSTRVLSLFTCSSDHVYYNHCRMIHFELKDGNTNVSKVNLYPVYRIADNKPGMYDIVNNVFYTNQGTGEFTVGPDKEWDE